MNDNDYMRLALRLAERGAGRTSPNPMVGAVIVKDGAIIGQGWHEACGGPHAERNALASCTESPAGATMYVTLEPCCHHGRQRPARTPCGRPALAGWWLAPAIPIPWWPAKESGSLRRPASR